MVNVQRCIQTLLLFVWASSVGIAAQEAGLGGNKPADSGKVARAARIRPPSAIQCPADRLTAFSGVVHHLSREIGQTTLRMHTDDGTSEIFTLYHPQSEDASPWFLLKGEPFTVADWKRIEAARNKLRPNMRATVWMCNDGAKPIVDWRPPQPRQKPSRAVP